MTSPLFEWTAGITAVTHDVYFGTTPELTAADHKMAMPAGDVLTIMEPLVAGHDLLLACR